MKVLKRAMDKKLWFMLFDVIIIYIVIGLGFRWVCGLNEYKVNSLDDYVTSAVYKADGSMKTFPHNGFDKAASGDIVLLNIKLPEECPYEDATLCTTIYNCSVEVTCDGELLYEYGKDIMEEKGELGNTLVTANISSYMWGKNIIMKLVLSDGAQLNKVDNIVLMPSEYSLRYVLINHEVDFVFCISIVGASIFALLIILTIGKITSIEREGIYLFLFFIAVGVWQLGSKGMLYLFINNPSLSGNLEYMAMFFMPIPFSAYLSVEFHRRFRKIFVPLTLMYATVFVTATILNYATDLHYYKIVHFERYLLAVGLMAIFIIIMVSHNKRSKGEKIVQKGIFWSMSVMMLEIIRYELCDIFHTFKNVFSTSIASFGIMIFVFSLLYGYYNKFSDEILKRKHLEQVAYTDGMTGISNRIAVTRFLAQLDRNKDYGIVFLDVNDLKKANDVYGHETGDKLITVVAQTLQESFGDGGFYGRYGGDEFVAGFYSAGERNIEESLTQFQILIDKANKMHELPFDIRVAYGSYINNSAQPLESKEAVKRADDAMYSMKSSMKSETDYD